VKVSISKRKLLVALQAWHHRCGLALPDMVDSLAEGASLEEALASYSAWGAREADRLGREILELGEEVSA
jgi:hypothetical protein